MLQGIFGAVPWNALSFVPFYLQSADITNTQAALVASSSMTGAVLGGCGGGWLGDNVEKWWPLHGRVLVAQCSVFSGIPLTVIFLLAIPPTQDNIAALALIMFSQGFCATWCLAGTNRPIMATIVPENVRATVFSVEYAVEGLSASLFGAPLVGLVAESIGYREEEKGAPLTHL